jgi:Tol biopolymer transport system component
VGLLPGTRLGSYEIVASIGEGGMGQVYRATDTKLKRQVAVKILPPAVAADRDRLARFQREAEVLASLSHPNIAGIYGLEESGGTTALVMELVEGEDLSEVIARAAGRGNQAPHAITIDDALPLARQIADALEAAHEQGIIHRDLKPANIKVRADGTVKVLDFGLAKSMDPVGASIASAGGVANSATVASPTMTQSGMIVGTAAYMSPEQARGRAVDKRADIWAFGVVLYEMLTGRRLFDAEDMSDTLAAVLTREVSLTLLPPDTPPRLRGLVGDCLVRDPKQRLRDIGDARRVLDRILAGVPDASGTPVPGVLRPRSRMWFGWVTAAVVGAMIAGIGTLTVVRLRPTPAPADLVQFTIAPEENSTLGTPNFAVSPDGRQVAFVAATRSVPMLWVRPLAEAAARALPGTEGAAVPFWSPDGRDIGFFAGGKLKRVPATSGPPVVLENAEISTGGAWNHNNVIVFVTRGKLLAIDAGGGTAKPVAPVEAETVCRWPSFLPDGQHVIYLAVRGDVRELRVASLDSADTVSLGPADASAVYADGHLLFSRDGSLMARPFNSTTRQWTGEAFLVADQVPAAVNLRSLFSVSATGVLVYYRGAPFTMSRLTWMDRAGKPVGTVGDLGGYSNLSLSPDERRVAVSMTVGTPANRDIWLIDLNRADTASRLTFDPANEADPIWSPDGSRILYNSSRNAGLYNSAFQRRADGGGQEELVAKTEVLFDSPDWSHDGHSVVFTAGTGTNRDLWVLPMSGDRTPSVFLQTPFNEESPAFSPDDRWVAYDSDASGRFEVYVRSLAPGGGQFRISSNGGWAPKWRGDGRELFFLALDGTMMAADITLAATIQAGVPHALFPTPLLRGNDRHTYAVTKGGKRFLFPVPDPHQSAVPLTIALNWPAMLKK